ncbi:hypothetical protein [Mesobacterium pallidum]|uniref:hypothetical protein n=1 Tax=Mesobacterium pallidum TaxID=2872037 RepID=UPI001EE1B615|nr:hypothetical protein [Mesobacterium pallidum]
MTSRQTLRAGLVFLDTLDFDLIDVANGLTQAIRDESYEVSEVVMDRDHEAMFLANGLELHLGLYQPRAIGDSASRDSFLHMPRIAAEDEDTFDCARGILVLSVSLPEGGCPLLESDARRLLAWSAYVAAEALAADFIHWRQPPEDFSVQLFLESLVQLEKRPLCLTPEMRLRREFLTEEAPAEPVIEIIDTPRPKRRSKAGDLPPLKDCEETLLDQAFADDMCVSPHAVSTKGSRDRMRLATWFVSLSIALFSLPLAGALFVMHLLRGENLRTASRAMAVLGLFMVASRAGMPVPGQGVLYF